MTGVKVNLRRISIVVEEQTMKHIQNIEYIICNHNHWFFYRSFLLKNNIYIIFRK